MNAEILATPQDLFNRMRSGEEGAFVEFVITYSDKMYALAWRFLRDEHAAADAVQDGFLSAFRSLDRFEGHSSLGTWLHRIVVNACLMKIRSRSRRRDISLDDLLPQFDQTGHHVEPVDHWSRRPDELLQRDEMRAQVRAMIDQLPDDFRTVVLLRDIEGLDTDETAEVLQVSTAVVKTRLHRARQALRTLLEPLFTGAEGGMHDSL